jgi:hypothetical protein
MSFLSKALGGVLGGAAGIAGGGAIGSALGSTGTLLGGLTGGILGGKAGSKLDLSNTLGTRAYSPNIDTCAPQQQVALAEVMRQRAMGEQPSYAETATRNALQDNLLAQQQGIRSIGGVSGALKQRMMANAAARSGSEMARRGGEAALQEREGALNQYGGLLSAIRSGSMADEAMRKSAFENAQAGKRQLISAAGQGIGSALGGKK